MNIRKTESAATRKTRLDAHVLMHVRGDQRSEEAADVHQRVVNRVADGANVFLRRARSSADHAWLDQRDAQRRQCENKGRYDHQRQAFANGLHPRRAQRAQQKIRAAEDEVGHRERAAEAHAVGQRASEDGEKPDQAAEEAGERRGLLDGKAQGLVQIARQRGEGRIVREALEELADVGDPEGPLEAGANVVPTLGEGH